MSDYSGRSRQGENMLRVIHFDHPEWTPVLVGFLPAAYTKYGEKLDDIRLAHPRLFPTFKPGQPMTAQDLYVAGKTTDCWGCVWDNLHEGMVGQVVGHPLADWKDFEGWKDINAVKNGRVFEVQNPLIFDFHTPRYPLALMIMAKEINPDKFQDLDLDAEIDNMFVDLYSVQYPGFAAA